MFYNKNSMAIAASVMTAICLTQENSAIFFTGLFGIYSIIVMAVFSPWLGLLALFPLLFSLPPAPVAIGIKELSFAILLGVVFIGALKELISKLGFRRALKFYGLAFLCGTALLAINLIVATQNGVHLIDWARGAIPFLFIYNFLSVAVLIRNDENRIRWLGASVATLIFLMAGYIVFYYFYSGIWRPYWLVLINDEVVRVPEHAALQATDAIGPMRDRITMTLAQATDALLPVGLVLGVVLATLARRKDIMVTGLLMATLCIFAVLTTFTRSMLLSSLLITAMFALFIFLFRKELRLKLLKIGVVLGISGLSFMFATGMQDIWIGRISQLSEIRTANVQSFYKTDPSLKKKLEFNVSSRLEEYKIAWNMFIAHPVLGNGLGIKHQMQWETSEKTVETKWVAYVHNWVFYILMVGGVFGFLAYSVLLGGPLLYRVSSIRTEPIHWSIIRTALLTMIVYGAFFAVFRLITFNLLMSVIWGVIFSKILIDLQKSKTEMAHA